jgi:hypothetical protein
MKSGRWKAYRLPALPKRAGKAWRVGHVEGEAKRLGLADGSNDRSETGRVRRLNYE